MMNNINNNFSFTGRSPLPSNMKKVKQIFYKEFKDVKSPAKYEMLPVEKQQELAQEIKEASNMLRFLRKFSKTFYVDGGLYEVFRGLIGCVKTFKVGNCAEFAEIGKTILKMNGIKNCDIYTLHARTPDGSVKNLDQTLIAFKVPKTKNNRMTKINGTMFEPSQDTPILDLWLDGFAGKVKQAKKKYQILGLNPEDKLLLKPENTYEPDLITLENLRKEYPNLVINKKTR